MSETLELRAALKRDTAALHDRLDDRLGALALDGDYVAFLATQYRARAAIEAWFDGAEASLPVPPQQTPLIAEDLATSRAFTFAWLGNGADWTPMAYTLFPPYKPTGAALLPNGDIVVVERRFTPPRDVGSRIARIARRSLRPGAPIQTTEIARIEKPFVTENFEAIAARSAGRGQTLIYLASDNNFSDRQRNLLLMFELLP